jgi:hypothetical protein
VSDRTAAVQITIGGRLAASAVPELAAAIEQEGASASWGGDAFAHGPAEMCAMLRAARRPLWLCDDQHRGNFDALEAFCLANGLVFVEHTEPTDFGDASIWWWAPGLPEVHSEGAIASAPALSTEALLELIDVSSPAASLARLRGRLERATPPEVPALEIVDVPPAAGL